MYIVFKKTEAYVWKKRKEKRIQLTKLICPEHQETKISFRSYALVLFVQ